MSGTSRGDRGVRELNRRVEVSSSAREVIFNFRSLFIPFRLISEVPI